MIRNRRPAAALALFATVGLCGVLAARMVRAVWATRVQQTPAHTASAKADVGAPGPFSTTVTSSIYSLQVEVGRLIPAAT